MRVTADVGKAAGGRVHRDQHSAVLQLIPARCRRRGAIPRTVASTAIRGCSRKRSRSEGSLSKRHLVEIRIAVRGRSVAQPRSTLAKHLQPPVFRGGRRALGCATARRAGWGGLSWWSWRQGRAGKLGDARFRAAMASFAELPRATLCPDDNRGADMAMRKRRGRGAEAPLRRSPRRAGQFPSRNAPGRWRSRARRAGRGVRRP